MIVSLFGNRGENEGDLGSILRVKSIQMGSLIWWVIILQCKIIVEVIQIVNTSRR
jgi:hypothetical protein